jgi:hypothetical protein
MKEVIATDSFTFFVNGDEYVTSLLNAVLLSPAVHEELLHDHTLNKFVIEDEKVTLSALSKLVALFSSDSVELTFSERQSMMSLC